MGYSIWSYGESQTRVYYTFSFRGQQNTFWLSVENFIYIRPLKHEGAKAQKLNFSGLIQMIVYWFNKGRN